MNDRTKTTAFALAVFAFASLASHSALAKGPRSLTIPACAQMSTLESTIDPNKPDAARKRRDVARLRRQCQAAMKAAPPAVERRAVVQPAPTRPDAPARPSSFEQRAQQREQLQQQAWQRQREQQQQQAWQRQREQQQRWQWQQQQQQQQRRLQQQQQQRQQQLQQGQWQQQQQWQQQPAPGPVLPPAAAPVAAPAAAPVGAPQTALAAPAPLRPSTAEQRNVFGIQLNEAFNVPACPAGVIDLRDARGFESTGKVQKLAVTANCSDSSAAAQPLAERIAGVARKPLPSGVKFALVRVSPQHCPSWVSGSCTASVTLKSNVVLGVAFLTVEDVERMVVRVFSGTYNGKPSSREPSTCESDSSEGTRRGTDSRWNLSDLDVSYRAVGGLDCRQGRVLVRMSVMEELLRPDVSGHAQPKL